MQSLKHFITLCCLVAAPVAAEAETVVSGEIATTTWTANGSPYRVTNSITLPSDETLTIEPGVDVLFDVPVRFRVAGSIIARGSESDSIRFLAGEAESWRGFLFFGENFSEFAYVRVSNGNATGLQPDDENDYGNYGGVAVLDGQNGAPELRAEHCVFTGNRAEWSGGAFLVRVGATLRATDCEISNNMSSREGGAVRLGPDGHVFLTRCTLSGNSAGRSGGAVAALWGETELVFSRVR